MISKKSRKVVAALLIGATVCASGTFAYFNSKVDLSQLAANNAGTQKTLDITNGKVKISGNIGGTGIADLDKVWTYDVARLSTDDTVAALYKADLSVSAAGKIKSITEDDEVAAYITKNQSPDILGVGGINANRTTRAAIGDAVTGRITLARPGDAFVLGTATSSGIDTGTGLEVLNESTLTTKVNLVVKDNAGKTAATAELTKLFAGGWKLYAAIDTKKATDAAYTDNAYQDISTIDQLLGFAPATLEPGESVKIRLRVELPLVTDNSKQDPTRTKNNDPAAAPATEVDLMKLFDIKVTQENNPGYSVDGKSDTVSNSDVANYPTGW